MTLLALALRERIAELITEDSRLRAELAQLKEELAQLREEFSELKENFGHHIDPEAHWYD